MNELKFEDIETLTPDIAAARCTEYTFKGKKLNPMTKTRCTAARCMGAKIYNGSAQPNDNGVWPEMFLDAQITVWLCSVDESRARRACVNSSAAMDDMFDWWDKEGGTFASPEEQQLLEVFGNILADIQTVSAEVDQAGGKSGASENLGE